MKKIHIKSDRRQSRNLTGILDGFFSARSISHSDAAPSGQPEQAAASADALNINVDDYSSQLRQKFPKAEFGIGNFHPGQAGKSSGVANVHVADSILAVMAADDTARHEYESLIGNYLDFYSTSGKPAAADAELLGAGLVIDAEGSSSQYEVWGSVEDDPGIPRRVSVSFNAVTLGADDDEQTHGQGEANSR